MDSADSVRQYYASFGQREWSRLTDSPDGYVEFALTCRHLSKHLVANSRVLDLGGGPGRYAIWLAGEGHRVVLADLSPELLEIAKKQISVTPAASRIEDICQADARDLSRWENDSFDAVLCLGPYYHLPDPEDRSRVTGEIARVLKAGGFVFAAFMAKLSFLRRTLALADERPHFLDEEWLNSLLQSGEFRNTVPGRFTGGYGVNPPDIDGHFSARGFDTLSLFATESIAGGIAHDLPALAHANRELHDKIIETLYDVAFDPSISGFYGHLLYSGKKHSHEPSE